MITRVNTLKTIGIEPVDVTCECEITPGIGIHLVGLADAAVKESLLRTVTAILVLGYRIPGKKIVINLAPSDLHKTGSGYDLAIALGILSASEQVQLPELDKWIVLGEVGLDASLRAVNGCVQAALTAQEKGFKGCIIPAANAGEIEDLVEVDAPVYAVSSITEAIEVIKNRQAFPTVGQKAAETPDTETEVKDSYYERIVGNEVARRAVEIAAAGGHNLILVGPEGTPNGIIAKAIAELLPPMTKEEMLTVAKIYSVAGRSYKNYLCPRPFRAPHFIRSMAAIFGGGAGDNVQPGEVSLANGGVLFLEDIDMFPKSVRESMHSVMEYKKVKIARLKSVTTYPADAQIVASCQSCPCGHYGADDKCTCSETKRMEYLSRLDSAMMDRIDIQVFVHPWTETVARSESEKVESVRERVAAARRMQMTRQGVLNSELDTTEISVIIVTNLSQESKKLIDKIIGELGLSARAYTRILKIARTIADLDGSETVQIQHIAEAASFRFLDKVVRPE